MSGIIESIAGSKLAALLGTAMKSEAGQNALKHTVPSFWNRAADEGAWMTVISHLDPQQQTAFEKMLNTMSKNQRAWLRQVVGNMDVVPDKEITETGSGKTKKVVTKEIRKDFRVIWARNAADRILAAQNQDQEIQNILKGLEGHGAYQPHHVGDMITDKAKELYEKHKDMKLEDFDPTPKFLLSWKPFAALGAISLLLLVAIGITHCTTNPVYY